MFCGWDCMVSNKKKKNCFLPFINFLFFPKNSGAKKQKIEISSNSWFFFNFPKFFLKFLEFFKRKINFLGFFEKFQENRPKFGIFSFFTDILVILFKKIWICIIISRNKSTEFFCFFLFFVRKKHQFFFVFCKKSIYKKNGHHRCVVR